MRIKWKNQSQLTQKNNQNEWKITLTGLPGAVTGFNQQKNLKARTICASQLSRYNSFQETKKATWSGIMTGWRLRHGLPLQARSERWGSSFGSRISRLEVDRNCFSMDGGGRIRFTLQWIFQLCLIVGCIGQRKHFCFPPSSPRFESRLRQDFSLQYFEWTHVMLSNGFHKCS